MAFGGQVYLLGGGAIVDLIGSSFWQDGAFPKGGDCGATVRVPGGPFAAVMPDTIFPAAAIAGCG